jgi:hypothetical protein
VDADLYESFKQHAHGKMGGVYGCYGSALEEAMRRWIGDNTHNSTQKTGTSKTHTVWLTVKSYLKTTYEYVTLPKGQSVPRVHLERAIGEIRGSDWRTLRKWLRIFQNYGYLKMKNAALYTILDDADGELKELEGEGA